MYEKSIVEFKITESKSKEVEVVFQEEVFIAGEPTVKEIRGWLSTISIGVKP